MAEKTIFAGITPRPPKRTRRHLVAVLAFDDVVLTDFAIPCEVFGVARLPNGERAYEVRVCGVGPMAKSACVSLTIEAPLTLLRKADTIVIPGISDPACSVPDVLVAELRRAIRRRARVATIAAAHLSWR